MSLTKIELSNITKTFTNKKALDNVSITFQKGKIHALLGENGAGKSTLVKILTGIIKQTSGVIKLNSQIVEFSSPIDSIKSGIGIIHQNPYLVENATIFENIVLGMHTNQNFFFNKKKLEQKIKNTMLLLGIETELKLNAKVNTLTQEKKFYTAFISVAYNKPDFIILDEPWHDFIDEKKLNFLKKLKLLTLSNNIGVILITHKLNDVVNFADHISILKKGKLENTIYSKSNIELKQIIPEPKKLDNKPKDLSVLEPILKITNITAPLFFSSSLKGISFNASKRLITAILTSTDDELELLENLLFGTIQKKYKKKIKGTFYFVNSNTKIKASNISPTILRKNKVALISSNRYLKGSNPKLTIYEMLISNSNKNKILNKHKELTFCNKLLAEQKIKANPTMLSETLSGGELQRLILARELQNNPDILILSKPEQGLDFEKTEALKNILKKQTEAGKSIIILTKVIEKNILKEIFDITYLYKTGDLCEIKN